MEYPINELTKFAARQNATRKPAVPKAATLRDQFAMAALAGLLASPDSAGKPEDFARWAYRNADAMMAERERQKP